MATRSLAGLRPARGPTLRALTDTPRGCAPDPSPSGALALAPPGCSLAPLASPLLLVPGAGVGAGDDPEHGHRASLDVLPLQADGTADAHVHRGCADDRGGHPQAGLFDQPDAGHDVALAVVDAGPPWPLVQHGEQVDHSLPADRRGLDVLRPTAGADRPGRGVPAAAGPATGEEEAV